MLKTHVTFHYSIEYHIAKHIIIIIFLGEVGVPTQVHNVTLSRGIHNSSPSLFVSWDPVIGSGITYTVCYSTSSGTEFEPPSSATCVSRATQSATILSHLACGTTYYVWVTAQNIKGEGDYSYRKIHSTHYGGSVCTVHDTSVKGHL